MIYVWSNRPRFLHLGLFTVAYVLGCGFAQLLAIVPGTGISVWPPGGLFMAALILAPRYSWPWWILAGLLAELSSNVLWFHSPLPAAVLIYVGNALEAAVGAWLVNRTCKRPVRLETLQEVLAFVVLGAGIAPVVSATVGSGTLAWFGLQSQTFSAAWPLWWIGDATGVLIVAPLALVVFQNWRGEAQLSAARWMEACVLGLIFLGVATLSLSGYLPFAYIIMPPLLWAAVRFEFKGAAVTLTLLALITAVFTISGASQFAGNPESQKHNQIMLQLFLAISAFSALIVAAISRQHHLAVLTLRQSERSLLELIETVPALLWRLAPDGEPIFFNKHMIDFLGLGVTDCDKPGVNRLAATIQTVVHPDDRAGLGDALNASLKTGERFFQRSRMRRADGVYRWIESRAEPMRDWDGVIIQWYGVSVDIDDEVRAQKALQESERQLQQIIDAVPANIWSWTPAGEMSYVSKRYLDYLGLTDANPQDFERVAQALVHPDDIPEVQRTTATCLQTGEAFVMRYRRREKNGSYRWMEGRCEPLRDRDGTIAQWYGVSLDVDDQVQSREELRVAQDNLARASQAASLAELSASIAHEVAQPLAAVVSSSDACRHWLLAEPPNIERAQKTLERILQSANSAVEVVSRIRALFKHSEETRNLAPLGRVISEARDLMAEDASRRSVYMDVDVASDLPLVAFDRVQIQQVLINLIRNAVDAMDTMMSDKVLKVRVHRMEHAIQVEISDRGRGIEVPDRIFEPFFTTKRQGMGMGLAICRSIVESHGGKIWAQKNEPQGAILVFTLPIEPDSSHEHTG
ncbi:MASE1 domain-containing protein [Rhizobium tibeticum]|uniref:MASE1 domain-containing protein n=1 Tax=Rhizobium tibeticum TaxID=501024 RepID=UPI0027D7ADB5|nr:MASE1 domain-containing protein [Rhizobium tibeticum]